MNNTTLIHAGKTPNRIHFIPEWAEKRDLKQVDIVKALDVDKGLVSRWFDGTVPKPDYLEKLRALFEAEEIGSLFRHPDDDWLAKFFRDKTEEQKEAAIGMLKLFFSQISGAQERSLPEEDRVRLADAVKTRIAQSDAGTRAEAMRVVEKIAGMRDTDGSPRKQGNQDKR